MLFRSVHEVVAEDQLDAKVTELTTTLLANGPAAMRAAKALIERVADHAIDTPLIEDTAARIADQRASTEGKEGVSAFLEKRQPDWI